MNILGNAEALTDKNRVPDVSELGAECRKPYWVMSCIKYKVMIESRNNIAALSV